MGTISCCAGVSSVGSTHLLEEDYDMIYTEQPDWGKFQYYNTFATVYLPYPLESDFFYNRCWNLLQSFFYNSTVLNLINIF